MQIGFQTKYTLIFNINENTKSEKEAFELELDALEYHTRAIATQKGILELEKHLIQPNI
jgi:TetR/AcrR family transcriptional regulator, biofilm operon repressor